MLVHYHIEMDGIPIEIVRKPIKNMHLRIYPPDGRVCVTAPIRLSEQYIYTQIEGKREWLHKQRARLQTLPATATPLMQTGEEHHYLGQAYTLMVQEGSTPTQLLLNENTLILQTKANATTLEKQTHLNHWYKRQMKSIIPELIKKWQPVIGVQITEWGIKTMKTRWGSCNPRAERIWLNLALIKKPMICIEYVLVHEMVHLLEASHNSRFYGFMDTFMPQWREHQTLLNHNR